MMVTLKRGPRLSIVCDYSTENLLVKCEIKRGMLGNLIF